jgi:TnpA family transposase
LLSPAQRTEILEAHLSMGEREIARYYTLTDKDLQIVRRHRRDHNRLGFSVQLCHLRYPGWPLRTGDGPPRPLLVYVARQLNVSPELFCEYARDRDTTRREHLVELQRDFGFQTFTDTHARKLADQLLPSALRSPKPMPLLTALIDHMRAERIIVPALLTVENLAWEILARAETMTFDKLTSGLTLVQRRHLDDLIASDSGVRGLAWLRQAVGRPTPVNFLRLCEKLAAVRVIGLEDGIGATVHQGRLQQLAREGARYSIQHLNRFRDEKRHALLVAFLIRTAQDFTDQAMEMHDQMIGRLFNRSERKQQEGFQRNAKAINDKVRLFAEVGKALIAAYKAKTDLGTALETVLGWDRLAATVEEAERLVEPLDCDFLDEMRRQYPQIRQYSPTLLRMFEFRVAPPSTSLLKAIELLRQMNESGNRKVPKSAPHGFVRQRWASHVFSGDEVDRCYYELCALTELRNGLRSGDVWVTGSRRYGDFDTYLIPKESWPGVRARGAAGVAVATDCARYLNERREILHEQLLRVDALAEEGNLPEARLDNDALHFTALSRSVPETAEEWTECAYDLLPRIKLTDLLTEVDGWTGFTRCFTHLHTNEPAKDKAVLLSAVLADATNQGLTKMGDACPGLTFDRLSWTADWHIREETYAKALAEIINMHHKLPFARHWGDGTTSSSDGQAFPISTRRPATATINAKYGRDPTVTFYTHVSDQYGAFHTKVINSTVRDALHVLDGLLGHDTDLRIREHYTDTSGFTDQVFGTCHMLGFRFAPRIRHLGDHKIYPIANPGKYRSLQAIIGGTVNVKRIEQSWDDLLRLISSIGLATVSASLILGKLAAYPRQNGLALALRELGRIERTLFTLEWIQSPELRRRVHLGLNKGEARNALARAIFFYRRGAVRDRLREDLQNKASGLNLVVAAIVLWNTVYVEQAVTAIEQRGTPIPAECLPHLSPLGWEHINLTGDYIWDLRQTTTMQRLRALRRGKLSVQNEPESKAG